MSSQRKLKVAQKNLFFLLVVTLLLVATSCQTSIKDIKEYGEKRDVQKLINFIGSNIYNEEKEELNKESIYQIVSNKLQPGINYLEKLFDEKEMLEFNGRGKYFSYFYQCYKENYFEGLQENLINKINTQKIQLEKLNEISNTIGLEFNHLVSNLFMAERYNETRKLLNSYSNLVDDTTEVYKKAISHLEVVIESDGILKNKNFEIKDPKISEQKSQIENNNIEVIELGREKSSLVILGTDLLENKIKYLNHDIRQFERENTKITGTVANIVGYRNQHTYYFSVTSIGIIIIAASNVGFNILEDITAWVYQEESYRHYAVTNNYGATYNLPLYFLAESGFPRYLDSKRELKEVRQELNDTRSENRRTQNKINNLESKIKNLEKKIEQLKKDTEKRIEKVIQQCTADKDKNSTEFKSLIEITEE